MDHPKDKQKTVITPPGRVSFPAVFKPEPKMGDSNVLEYSLTLLIPKTEDITEIRNLVRDTFRAKWPDANNRPKTPRNPIRDGDEESWDGYAGCWFIRAKSQFPPGLVDSRLKKIISEQEFYPGCWARVQIGAFAYDNKGNAGVSFNLNNIMKVKDDDPFSSRQKAEDAFASYGAKELDGSEDPANYAQGETSKPANPDDDPF